MASPPASRVKGRQTGHGHTHLFCEQIAGIQVLRKDCHDHNSCWGLGWGLGLRLSEPGLQY